MKTFVFLMVSTVALCSASPAKNVTKRGLAELHTGNYGSFDTFRPPALSHSNLFIPSAQLSGYTYPAPAQAPAFSNGLPAAFSNGLAPAFHNGPAPVFSNGVAHALPVNGFHGQDFHQHHAVQEQVRTVIKSVPVPFERRIPIDNPIYTHVERHVPVDNPVPVVKFVPRPVPVHIEQPIPIPVVKEIRTPQPYVHKVRLVLQNVYKTHQEAPQRQYLPPQREYLPPQPAPQQQPHFEAPQQQYLPPQREYLAPQPHLEAPAPPRTSYGVPAQPIETPTAHPNFDQHFEAPQQHFEAPQQHFEAPQQHFDAPQPHFDAPQPHVEAPVPQGHSYETQEFQGYP